MKLLENMNYLLTDRRKKITLFVSVIVAITILILQAYLIEQSPISKVLISIKEIQIGEMLTEINTQYIEIEKSYISEYKYVVDWEEKIAVKQYMPGELILNSGVENKDEYIEKKSFERIVTLKLDIEKANGWDVQIGDCVEISHYDKEKLNSLKIFSGAIVYGILSVNSNDAFPTYIVLLVSEEQRDYILLNRNIGRFEISN